MASHATRCLRTRHVPLTVSDRSHLLTHLAWSVVSGSLVSCRTVAATLGPRYGLCWPCWPTHLPFPAAKCGKACPFPRPSFPPTSTLPPALGAGRTRDFLWADRIRAPSLTRLPSTLRARLGRSSLRYGDRPYRQSPKPTQADKLCTYRVSPTRMREFRTPLDPQHPHRSAANETLTHTTISHISTLVSLAHLATVIQPGMSAKKLHAQRGRRHKHLLALGPAP